MTTLVVLDHPENSSQRTISYINAIGQKTKSKQILLLNLTDLSEEFVLQHLTSDPSLVTYVNGFELYTKIDEQFIETIKTWLETFVQHNPRIPLLEYSRLSEQNFSIIPFQDLKRLHLISYTIDKYAPSSVLYIGTGAIRDCIQPLCQQTSTPYVIHPPHYVPLWFRSIKSIYKAVLITSHNLFTELIFLIYIRSFRYFRRQEAPPNKGVGVYALYPTSWLVSNTKRHLYRYSYNLVDHINRNDKGYYFVSILRQNSDALRPIYRGIRSLHKILDSDSENTYVLLEEYGSLSGLIRSYFDINGRINWFRSWARTKRSKYWHCFGVDVTPLFKDICFSAFREIPKNLYTEYCSQNAAWKIQPKRMYIPVFELLEGRAITAGHHAANVEVIGVQHAIMYNLQIPRAVSSMSCMLGTSYSNQLPDLIAVEGNETRRIYSSYNFPDSKLQVVGAPRLQLGQDNFVPPTETTVAGRRNVLIFDDMYASGSVLTMSKMISKSAPVLFRSHPSRHPVKHGHTLIRTAEELDNLPDFHNCVNGFYDISLINLSISELVEKYRPLASLCRMSTVSIEMLKLGVPVILIGSNQYPMVYPMLKQTISPLPDIPILSKTSEITEELESLKSSTNYQISRIVTGHNKFFDLIDRLGEDACHLLSTILLANNSYSNTDSS